tara:strand:+ start:4168 stop:4545 length:378 start_codon:yes stop_codon:yes gene_type:complete
MNLVDQAKSDWQQITTDKVNGFGTSITLTSPTSVVLEIVGLATKHHIGIDDDGNVVNTKNAHISFSEQQLIDASYPTRDADNEVNLYGHQATWIDSTGSSITYTIREFFPDETMGVILCILGDLE